MLETERPRYYFYKRNGKEYFTANLDLASKRTDEEDNIKVYYGKLAYE